MEYWHAISIKEVYKKLNTSEQGLDESEVKARLKKYGMNDLGKLKAKNPFLILLSQFKSLLIIILIIAMIISFLIGHILDACVIFAIVLLNGIIGFIQEYKAEEIIEKLRESLDYKVFVFRNNQEKEISSKFLVPGDIIVLNEGMKIPTDCRIINQHNLGVNEAILTGESFPIDKTSDIIEKDSILAERKNMLYAGTTVVRGKCLASIVSTGRETEFGSLAETVQQTREEKMPLEKKIDEFGKIVSFIIIGLVIILFFVGIYLGMDKMEMFLISISLAVGAIPEGLPAIIAITLAVAIKRMYRSDTLIRKLPAVETLGRTTLICTDKTGTLTEESLEVDEIFVGGKFYTKNSNTEKNILQILKIGVLCNDARDEQGSVLGDPTEVALIKIAKIFGIDKKIETEKNPRIAEYSFDSERKMMSVIRKYGEIKTSYVKGAGIEILKNSTKEFVNGRIQLLSNERKKELKIILHKMESKGLRVLGFGFKQIPSSSEISQKNSENQLIFVGFQGMIDPPRKEVKEAVENALSAGIEIKILTGDSEKTTKAIAERLGLHGEAITGQELDKIPKDNEKQWNDIVRQKTIFARITPHQKLKIVEILKKQKHIVAVTGDGVNDILALKKADIGISMGIRGADATRDASDMVLLDDNFASIIKAVREGRRVFDNLKKSIKFLLAANAAQIFIILFILLLRWPLPFLPLAILWMNLVTDSLPALALAVEPTEQGIMKKKPRKDGLLSGIWSWILIAGILNFVSVIILFYWALGNFSLEIARTMAVSAAVLFELFFAFSCKSEESLFKTGILNNKWLLYSIVISAGLHLLAVYTPLGIIFQFVPLTWNQLGISIVTGLSGLVVFEVWKIFKRR